MPKEKEAAAETNPAAEPNARAKQLAEIRTVWPDFKLEERAGSVVAKFTFEKGDARELSLPLNQPNVDALLTNCLAAARQLKATRDLAKQPEVTETTVPPAAPVEIPA